MMIETIVTHSGGFGKAYWGFSLLFHQKNGPVDVTRPPHLIIP